MDAEELNAKVNEFANEYNERRFERHQMGEKKYGAGTWIKVETIEEALAELLDAGNYIQFTYVKLRMLQENILEVLKSQDEPAKPLPGHELDGKNFIGRTRDING